MDVNERSIAVVRAISANVHSNFGAIPNLILSALISEREFASVELLELKAKVKQLERELAIYKRAIDR